MQELNEARAKVLKSIGLLVCKVLKVGDGLGVTVPAKWARKHQIRGHDYLMVTTRKKDKALIFQRIPQVLFDALKALEDKEDKEDKH